MPSTDRVDWNRLKGHFSDGKTVATLAQRWTDSVGKRGEEEVYRELVDEFLHQSSISVAAYAVVPHVISALRQMKPAKRLQYLCDVASVEVCRMSTKAEMQEDLAKLRRDKSLSKPMLKEMLRAAKERMVLLPPELEEAYFRAIADARDIAVELLPLEWGSFDFCRILGVLTGLYRRQEAELVAALLHPEGLSFTEEVEGMASLASILVDRPPPHA